MKEEIKGMLKVSGILFKYNVPAKEVKQIGSYIEKLVYEKQQLKEQLQQKEDIINKAKKYNKQIIKDTKYFFRPTAETIYSGDCLIELANKNIEILNNKGE